MSRHGDEKQPPAALLPEQDEHVDVAVALGRGELAEAQAREVRARMQQDANYRAVVEPIALAYKEPPLSAEEVRSAWPKLVRAAGMPESVAHAAVGAPVERDLMGRRQMISMLVGSVAALGLVIAGLGTWDYVSTAREYETVTTAPNQTVRLMLPDQSRATIGPSSQLKFRKWMWSDGVPDRVVWPKGDVTLHVRRVQYDLFQRGKRLSMFRIEASHAWVNVVSTADVRVVELPTSTTVEVLEGVARVRQTQNGRAPSGNWIELQASSGVRLTASGVERYTFPRDP